MSSVNREKATRPIKALFVNAWTELGGAELSLLGMLQALPREKIQPSVVTLGYGRGDLPERIRAANIETIELQVGIRWNPLALSAGKRSLAAAIKSVAPDIVVSNGSLAHLWAAPAAGRNNLPCVFFFRDWPGAGRSLFCGYTERRALWAGTCGYLCASQAVANQLSRYVGARASINIVPPGIDNNCFKPDSPAREKFRRSLGIEEQQVLIGLAARMQEWKGGRLFLEAASEVLAAFPGARFVLSGGRLCASDRSFERRLAADLVKSGITDRVIMAGYLLDMKGFWNGLDIAVSCSLHPEPFGRGIVEAMLCGKAVIASGQGGPAEIISSGRNGLLFEAGSKSSLAAGILKLCRDSDLRQELGARALERAAEYSPQASADAAVKAITDLLRRL
jgi:glycosyltransferase involved in cell wall biosynthesis